ncbi:MAG: alpha/beta hydrolase [Cellulomonas sp.]|jgi:pimeloyl-ACP methyl ester carboxylesterase|nr:alpha/beta hydrolase [Cellulomonas sp.]
MYRAGRVAAVAVCAALGLAGCSSGKSDDEAEATKVPAGLEAYYSQDLDWKDCGDQPDFSSGSSGADEFFKLKDLECAWLTVPMDYDDPDGETITLAVARSVAKDSQGSVVINPGGPGGSGVDMVSYIVNGAGDKLRDSLDVVGFDPRGVGRSAPVDCLSDADMDLYVSTDIDLTTEAGLEQARTQMVAFAQGCAELTGPVLAHVDTISAARDMDVLRAALHEPTLTYLGISYGTQLGATYAQLFPDRVGAMVLDGAVDPTVPPEEQLVVQAGGFESALRAYVEDCLASGDDCPLSGSVDEALTQIVDLVEQTRTQPLRAGAVSLLGLEGSDRLVTRPLALTGIMASLYSQGNWIVLTLALQLAIEDQNGALLLALADSYNSRCEGLTCPEADGYYANADEAHPAISCADARAETDPQVLADTEQAILAAAPTLGRFLAEGLTENLDVCTVWPTPVAEPLESYAAEGAPPIVVVGTTNDPATPYVWAQNLASMLDSGVLVTNEGEGHAGYLGGTECLQTAVDDYLVDGKVPADGLTCSAG